MRKTNKTLIKKLTTDTVSESFLIEAVTQYCKTVINDKTDWGNSLINKQLWQVIASTNLELMKEHYK
jgi:hypothetical protein